MIERNGCDWTNWANFQIGNGSRTRIQAAHGDDAELCRTLAHRRQSSPSESRLRCALAPRGGRGAITGSAPRSVPKRRFQRIADRGSFASRAGVVRPAVFPMLLGLAARVVLADELLFNSLYDALGPSARVRSLMRRLF